MVCPVCRGSGCTTCRGIGKAIFLGGRWAYWDRRVDGASIAEQGAERAARGLVAVLLLAFGLLGIIFLVIAGREYGVVARAPWDLFSAARGDPRLALFALSLLTDVFFVYRVLAAQEGIGRIPRPAFGDEPVPLVIAQVAEAASLPKDDRINVGTVLTAEALRALEEAWQLSARFRAGALTPAFLFASLLAFQKVVAVRARLGLDEEKLHALTAGLLQRQTMVGAPATPIMDASFRDVLLDAFRRAFSRRSAHVDVTDLFAAVGTVNPTIRDLLDEFAVTPVMFENVVAWITMQEDLRRQWKYFRTRARFKPKGNMNRAMTAIATPLLDRLSNDLTQLAKNGYLHPCVARDREMESILRLIEGGNDVLLIGNPGVGKTSLLEGLAQRMVTEDVPPVLQDKRLVSLSIAALVGAGAGGDVEQRLTIVLNEVVRSGNIVLVLENIQNLVGVNSGGGATLDLSEVLSSVVGDKKVIAIATTNPVDYRRYIETSSGLSSSFSPVQIEEVEANAAIQILESRAGSVEYEHHVYFSYAAVEKIVTLAKRYLHDRALPEKALNLMQEAAVAVHKTRGARSVVNAEDVARVIAGKTNIAVTQVTEEESVKLLHLEERMHERMVGQNEAVDAVASALRRARVELRDAARPIANFLFLGPTGVGKTELAKTVAEVYFGDEQNMIRLDMSEYQEPESINRLIGPPPGFRGASTGGYLTDAVREKPFALVLLDELEKAHPDVLNVFLQVMDDGRLTDGAGRTVDFTNVILIATSNAGTDKIQEGMRASQSLEMIKQQLIEEELGKYFRPEFLNRFDQIVVFRPLSKSEIIAVAGLMIRQVTKRLAEKGISFEASEAAIRELADVGFDPLFGARPLRRVIQDRVDNALAKFLLTGKIGRRDRVVLEAGGVIRVEEAPSLWEKLS